MTLLSRLEPPETRGLRLDSPAMTVARRQVIRRKKFLEALYHEWYRRIASALPANRYRPVLELGSGAGFADEAIGDVITSEVVALPGLDLAANGLTLPFSPSSLDGIIMVDVFHHLPKAESFLVEAGRCLAPGGRVVMIEPWVTPFSRLVFSHLHHEPFVPESRSWGFPSNGPLSASNQALPWIVFERDRQRLADVVPELEVESVTPDYPVSYLVSGGLTIGYSPPAFLLPLVRAVERPFVRWTALFAFIVLRRRND
jgi:SAM-dependent methyltransferase